MDNIVINKFNDKEYICIKKVSVEGNEYYVFLDSENKKNVKITDTYLNTISDKETLRKVSSSVFAIFNGIIYNKADDKEEKDTIVYNGKEIELHEIELRADVFESVIKALKKEFFGHFGRGVISEEELDRRISENLTAIVISNKFLDDNCTHSGEYCVNTKTIKLASLSFKDPISISILFHEFIHAITSPGARKDAYIEGLDDENIYNYGSYIDEGIVSYRKLISSKKVFCF